MTAATAPPAPPAPAPVDGKTRQELLGRAADLVPALRDRAAETERLGRITDATVADLRAAGLLRAGTPERFGGYPGADYDLSLEVAAELARGCASTGWCYSVWQSHNWQAGSMTARAQEDYFASGPDVITSTASSPVRTEIEFLDHGYRVSGHWKFASGSDHSEWFLLGLPDILGGVLVPRSQVTVLDSWRPPGLRGTGSNDVTCENVEVPAHRLWTPLDARLAGGPLGWQLIGQDSYRMHMWMLAYTIVAPVVGAARGALESFVSRYAGTAGPGRTGTSVTIQIAAAEAAAEVDAADALWRRDLADVLAAAAAGEGFSTLRRATIRRNQAYAAKLAVRSVTRLFESTGAHALDESDLLQRFFRDVHAASHHITVPWEQTLTVYGETLLGHPSPMEFQRDGIDPALFRA